MTEFTRLSRLVDWREPCTGLLPRLIPHCTYRRDGAQGVDPSWLAWSERWDATSTLAPRARLSIYYGLLKAGRWLAQAYPVVRSAAD